MSKRKYLFPIVVYLIVLGTILPGCLDDREDKFYIYHAGSLAIPFGDLSEEFEDRYPEIEIRRESAGSLVTVRKVTDQGKEPDILAVADHRLIRDLMYEKGYADWTISFATNEMVLAYTEKSLRSGDMREDNWYSILGEKGVRFGFSNPNHDPCGYRSQMVILLAEEHYGDDTIFEELIQRYTSIRAEGDTIMVPPTDDLGVDTSKIMMRSAEVDLMSALSVGEIDYLFIYRSVAEQHTGVHYLKLPDPINLGNPDMEENYGRIKVERDAGEMLLGRAIVYGITIPSTAHNKEMAIRFVEFLLSERGRDIMEEQGHPPLVPARVDKTDDLPDMLKHLVEEED